MIGTTPAACLDCGRTLVTSGVWARASRDLRAAWVADGRSQHRGRGMCARCRERRRVAGTLDERPPVARRARRRMVLEEWEHLGGDSNAWPSRAAAVRALAPRLGMSGAALYRALNRAGVTRRG
jgi:hypothetical protein